MKKYTLKHVFITLGALAALVAVLYTTIILRDYSISFRGGPHLEAKTSVPGPPGFSLTSPQPGKLRVDINANGAVAYDVQVSRFKNFLIARSFRTVLPYKEVGLMRSGKTYYVRTRSVAKKEGTIRRIHGNWGQGRPIKIQESTKAFEQEQKKQREEQKEKAGFRSGFKLFKRD